MSEELTSKIKEKIASIHTFAEELPGVVIIHNIKDFSVEYISSIGELKLGITTAELKSLGLEYYSRFFNPEDADDYVPKIFGLLERNNNEECLSFFNKLK